MSRQKYVKRRPSPKQAERSAAARPLDEFAPQAAEKEAASVEKPGKAAGAAVKKPGKAAGAAVKKPAKPLTKKRKTLHAVLLAAGSFITVTAVGAIVLFFVYFGGLQTQALEMDDSELGISSDYESSQPLALETKNIALFGIDGRTDQSRSDCIIIININPKLEKVKMVSVMRDSYVDINGSMDKIGHAYAYGGAELAVQTLNQNFNLNIRDYVTVNFETMAEVVDAVGGVTLEITEAEMNSANRNIRKLNPSDPDVFTNYGMVHMSGEQALGFSRIRNIDSDQERTNRQRKVLTALIETAMDMDTMDLPRVARKVIPMVTATSLNYADIIEYASMLSPKLVIEQAVIPKEYGDQMINGVYYSVYDLDEAADVIHDFFYEDIHPDRRDEQSASASSASESMYASSALTE